MVTSSLYRKHNGFFLFKMWMYFFILGLFIQPGYTGTYTCPSKCACVDSIHNSLKGYNVNCSGVNLTSIPSTTDKDANQVYRLFLSKNSISMVAANDFTYFTGLLELDLSFNSLSSITAGVFDSLTNLQILNLQGNGISSFSSKTFDIKNLISLNLAYNNFTVLNKDFLGQDNIQYLNISYLQLTSIPSALLSFLGGLVSVDLSFNQITSLPKSSFNNRYLQYINLAGNRLTQLGDDVFFHEKTGQITEVDLSQNLISSITTDAFSSLFSATTLKLSRNKLTTIPSNLFIAVASLQELYLDNNFLSSLDSSVFTYLPALQKLYLQNNNLTTLISGTFSKQTGLTTINLSGNLWVCDKDLYWLKTYLKSKTTLTVESTNNTLCTDSVGNTTPLLDTGDYFWRPEDIYSCYDDEYTGDNQVIIFSRSSFKIPVTECQKYCFEQDLRYSLYESMVCLCGSVGTYAGCTCPAFTSSSCLLTQINGVQHVTAGIAIQPVPTLTVGVAYWFNATTTLASVNNFIWSFGDSSLTYPVTASSSTVRSHTYIRPGNYTVMLMACYGTMVCDTGTVPVTVQVANDSLVTYLTYVRTAHDVSEKLDATSTFLQGYDFQYTWSRTDSRGTLTTVKTCPSGWSAYRYKCLKLKTSAKDFTSASSDCSSDSATLISLDFPIEVTEVLSHFSLNGSSYNVLTNGMKVAGIYQWVASGKQTYFSNSDLVDSASGNCIIIQASTKKLTSTPCTTAHTYICQKDPMACPYGGSVYNSDRCFVLNNLSVTWKTAQSNCESSYPNGELAIIDSADVQNFVAGLFASAAINEAWIGLSDRVLEGYKVWVDGTSFDPSSDFNLMSGSWAYDCVVTNRTAWLSVNCNSGRGYVCQYNLNNRTTVSTYIAGRYDLDIPEGQSLISLSEASMFTGSATSTVHIFPGLWFSRSGTIRRWNFHAKLLSTTAKVILQVYRPTCTSNFVIQPACIPGIAYSSCSASSSSVLKCQTLTSPDDKNPCYLTNTSLPYYEICNCHTKSYTCGTGTVPTYHLIGQTLINLDAGPEQSYTLSTDIAVKELDVLGFQFESTSNPIKCTGSGATDDELYAVPYPSWLTKGNDVTVFSKQSMTCYFQAVYASSQEIDIPSNLAYFSSVGQYTVQIEIPESKDKKSFTIDLIEPVASVVWVYPAKLEPAATKGSEGTVYVEYGKVYDLTVRAGMGSSLSSIWSLDGSTPVNFSSSCPTSVASLALEDCNTTLYWSKTPFSSLLHRFDVGDMTSQISVNISNSVSYKFIFVDIVKLVPLTSISLNHTGPSNPMRVGENGLFTVYGVLGTVEKYYYAVNGSNVTGFSGISMQYLFSIAGTYNVTVMAVNKLGTTLGAWKSVEVKPAAGFTNLKFTSASFLAAVSKNYMLSISVDVSVGAEVTVGWNFGDASSSTSVTIITSSTTLFSSENKTYFSVGIYTATLTVKDAFEEQSLSVNITVCSSIPASASVVASVTEFIVGSSVSFAVTVPLSPGPYCDITYTWDFNDGSTSSGPTNDSSKAKMFTSAKSYNVTVLISNTVSQQTVFIIVIAIEKVQGLELVYDGPTLLTQPTVFTLTTTAGTNMLYNFYCSLFNDTVTSPTYSYTFPNKGRYNVSVVAYNTFSSTNQTITAYVIDNITLELTVDTPTDCFATKESQNFKVEALHYNPSLLTFNWSFGDGTSSNMKNYNKSYTLPGQMTVTLMVSDGTTTASENRFVCVIEKIVGAKISNNGPIGLPSGGVSTATVTVVTLEGSNLTYIWTLGSSIHNMTNNSFTVIVSLPGIIQVNATVSNILSSTSLSTDIQVQTFISGLAIVCQQCIYNSAKGLYYIGINSTVTFIASVTEGDNVTYIWDLGGGNSGLFGSAQTNAYSVEGTYTVIVNASNSVGSSSVSISVTVETSISLVTIQPSNFISATNAAITFRAVVSPPGISIKSYEWVPCNTCIAQNGTSDSVTFNYTTKGYQTCKVTASNDISSVSSNTTIRIVDKIEYVIIKTNLTNIKYAPFNVSVYFYAELNTDDDLNYSWIIRKENILDQMKTTKDIVYVFDSMLVKYYTISLRCMNSVSSSSATATIYIEEQIDGLVLTSNVSSVTITPDMSLLLTASVTSGNNINYTWSQNVSGVTSVFSSGRNDTSVWTPKGSGKYNLTVTATNNINTEQAFKFVEVQEVIFGVNMTCTWPTARQKPYIATSETLICTGTVVWGDNLQYYWSVSHDGILDYSIALQTLNNTFSNQGVYNVTLKVQNLVSAETTSMLVFVENEIPAFTLNADVNPAKTGQMVTFTTSLMDLLYIKFNWTIDVGALIFNDNGTIPSTFTAGMHSINVIAFNNISSGSADLRLLVQDPIRNLTVVNCAKTQSTTHPLTLMAIFDAGTNISFVWTLSISATSSEIVYGTILTHAFTEAGSYSVQVNGSNLVSFDTYQCVIPVIGMISNVTVHLSTYLFANYPITFTLTGTNLANSNYLWSFSNGENVTTTVPLLDKIFTVKGNYTLTVTVFNDINSVSKVILFSLDELRCIQPYVQNVGRDSRITLMSRSVEFEVSVNNHDCIQYTAYNQWKIYKNSCNSTALGSAVTLDSKVITSTPQFTIPASTLKYGTYCVVFTVSYPDTPLTASVNFSLKIMDSPLQALLVSGSESLYPAGTAFTLDASTSYDPDNMASTMMTYTWTCLCTNPSVPPSTSDMCTYVSGRSSLTISIPAGSTLLGQNYNISVTVSATNRISSTATQIILIGSSAAPFVVVTCISCQATSNYKISKTSQISLMGSCTNCQSGVTSTYLWTVETIAGVSVGLSPADTTTGLQSTNLVIKSGVLDDGTAYKFKLTVSSSGQTGYSSITLDSNTPPSGGTCILETPTITYLEQRSNFSCMGWKDSDNMSEVYYEVVVRRTISATAVEEYLVYYGTQENTSLYISPWPDTGDAAVNVIVYVKDDLEASKEANSWLLSFRSPSLSPGQTKLDYLVDNMKTQLLDIVNQNNPSLLVQYIISTLMVLNDLSASANTTDTNLTTRAAIRDLVTVAITGLPIDSVSEIQQLAFAFKLLTEYTTEILTDEYQNLIMNTVSHLIEILTSKVSQGMDQDDFDPDNLLGVITNTIEAINLSPDVITRSNTTAVFGDHFQYRPSISSILSSTTSDPKQLVADGFESGEKLVGIALTTKLVGEDPVNVVMLNGVTFKGQRVLKENIWTAPQNQGSLFSCGVNVLDGKVSDKEELFQIVFEASKNQFDWEYIGNHVINSRVASMSFKYTNSSDISISNLDEASEVKIYMFGSKANTYNITNGSIINSTGYNPTEGYTFTTSTLDAGASKLVNLNVKNASSGVALHIPIQISFYPTTAEEEAGNKTNQSGTLNVYLGINKKETKSSDYTPGYFKSITMDMMTKEYDHRAYTFFIPASTFSPSDKYSLAIYNLEPDKKVNVSIGMLFTSCQYFNTHTLSWDMSGCTSLEESIPTVTACSCNHMTSYGGSFLMPLDAIDFADFAKLDLAANPIAVITCSLLLFLYIVMVIVCALLDRMDMKRISMVPLCGKDGSFKYEITVVTGRQAGAGTTAHVGVRLCGEYGKTKPQHLQKAGAFQRNCQDKFIIAHDVNLGDISKVSVWHDNNGKSPAWYLTQIIVKDLQTYKKYYFFADFWLSLEMEEGIIQKDLKVADSSERYRFKRMFSAATSNSLADKHLWLSLFNRPAHSRFTRVQRASCLVTLLYTFMCVNAIWYGILKQKTDPTDLSSFGWEEVIVGLVSNIVMFPITFCLIWLFRKSRSKSSVFDHGIKPMTAQTIEIDNMCDASQAGDSFQGQQLIPYDLERESTVDSYDIMPTSSLHRTKAGKLRREGTDDSLASSIGAGARPKTLPRSKPMWSHDAILKWPEKMPSFMEDPDSRPSTGATVTDAPTTSTTTTINVKQPPTKAGGASNGTRKTEGKSGSEDLISYLDQMETELKDKEFKASVKRTGSTKQPVSVRRVSADKSSRWGSLEDILNSDDESTSGSNSKRLKKRESRSTLSSASSKPPTNQSQRNFNPREEPNINQDRNGQSRWPVSRQSVSTISSANGDSLFYRDNTSQSFTGALKPGYVSRFNMEEPVLYHKPKNGCTLPHWCVYLAYVLCFLLSVVSIALVMLYCYNFGYDRALEWVLAFIFALLLSVFLFEPLKAMCFALYMALCSKKVELDEEEDIIDIEPSLDNTNEKFKEIRFRPLAGYALLQAKEEGRKVCRMKVMVRQFFAYMFYLWLLLVITYVHLKYDGYLQTKSIEYDFITATTPDYVSFRNISSINEFWDWTENVLTRGLFLQDSSPLEEHGELLGTARMRQIRGVGMTCQAKSVAEFLGARMLTNRTCHGTSSYDENTKSYGESWNESSQNLSWMYSSATQLGSGDKLGFLGTYGGGGYVQTLGTSEAEAASVVANLRSKGWIDLSTRAVVLEFTKFSAGTEMTALVSFLVEFQLTGRIVTSYETLSHHLLWFQQGQVDPLLVCEVILFLVVIYTLVHLAVSIRDQKKKFFMDFWNWYEMLTTLLCILSIGLYVGSVVEATNTFQSYFNNKNGFTNFERTIYVHTAMKYVQAWLLFLLIFKVVKQMRFIKCLHVYELTLSRSVGKLMGVALIFTVLLTAYAMLGNLMYGKVIEGFQSVGHTMVSLVESIRGTFDFWPLFDYQPVFSHFYFYSFYAFVYGITIALVIAILNDMYSVIRSQMLCKVTLEMHDYEMIDFMLNRFKLWTGIKKPKPAFRKVRFQGLPSASSRASSSYSSRPVSPISSLSTPEYSRAQLDSMMLRVGPTWQMMLKRFEKIETLDKEEETLLKRTENELKDWKFRQKISNLEKEGHKLLETKPLLDSRLRQSIPQRKALAGNKADRRAPASVSTSRVAATPPSQKAEESNSRRPLSDQGARGDSITPRSGAETPAPDPSTLKNFLKILKPSKAAWNK
ncbi:hypothetical protein CHS0354_039486 [Potamilus streckersoni]|uniref:Uncharacterized protein n=1 Tax=Potamilus streckersoni TaxID=2493646 RepID=A0AAE0TLQ8_9BIVA|nr:hypothetical protein CHS0354_039486 [Potamilus streckersoni]